MLILVPYIFVAFQFKKTSACFNSVEKKRERIKKIRRENERGNKKKKKQKEEREKGEEVNAKSLKRQRKGDVQLTKELGTAVNLFTDV